MTDHLIIVAAGTGSRMKTDLPKQFLQLAGKPVLQHTLEKFHTFNPRLNIVVVLHPEYLDFWNELNSTFRLKVPHRVIAGGDERFYSVKNGLNAISETNGIVGIHDAVRPLVSLKTIESCYNLARTIGNAIPVLPVNDTIRNLKGEWIDRNQLRIVQTPQCFELSLLRIGFQQYYRDSFTDDASVVSEMGEKLYFTEGNRENFKITTAEDLRVAEALISQ